MGFIELYKGIFLQPKVYTELLKDDSVNIKFKGVSKDTQKDFTYNTYLELLNKIRKGEESHVVEKNHMLMPSIGYLQKVHANINTVTYRDKKMYLQRKQKRNINYFTGDSEAWFIEKGEFKNFNLNTKKESYFKVGNGHINTLL